jgi:hypothetical protein
VIFSRLQVGHAQAWIDRRKAVLQRGVVEHDGTDPVLGQPFRFTLGPVFGAVAQPEHARVLELRECVRYAQEILPVAIGVNAVARQGDYLRQGVLVPADRR